VRFASTAEGQGVIDAVLPRSNLFYRSDAFRAKRLAANLTQLCTVVAAYPPFSEALLGRSLVASEASGIRALIVLNKIDLTDAARLARGRLALYRSLGYRCLEVSLKMDPQTSLESLLPEVADETTVLVGQSGMGKSSLLNLLVPDAKAATREISEALRAGQHTTTDARLYHLPGNSGMLIDTPGFQEFGLAHLTPGVIERAFPDLKPYLGHCRFYNCTHLIEPGCAVRSAVDEGKIERQRYDLFSTLTRESAAEGHAATGLD
jgi:ribosome biogenesis GTPase